MPKRIVDGEATTEEALVELIMARRGLANARAAVLAQRRGHAGEPCWSLLDVTGEPLAEDRWHPDCLAVIAALRMAKQRHRLSRLRLWGIARRIERRWRLARTGVEINA